MLIDLDNVMTAFRTMGTLASPSSDIHSTNTSHLALQIGGRLGMEADELVLLKYGADLHDLGKMFLESNILHKPGKLNKAQRAHVEAHPRLGFESLEPLRAPRSIAETVLFHHEHWDGSGYPSRLKMEQIPVHARIVAIADMWDALVTDRPHRPAYSTMKALEIMAQHAHWFDPKLFAFFLGIVREGNGYA